MDVREKLVDVLKKCGVCNTYALGHLVNALVENGVTVQEWVSVDDRLPKKRGRYLTANRTHKGNVVNVYDLWFENLKWYVDEDDDLYGGTVTHWMPLPQPPKDMKKKTTRGYNNGC